jgi:NADPH-dependent 2,4-dienoyl-CoA reductase/sulfur reductase-like enzyme
MRTVCVVGASLAGLSTARALRNQGYDGRLVVVGEEPHRPYDRPPLSKEFLAGEVASEDLSLESDEDLGIEWRLGVPATGLLSSPRAVLLADGRHVEADGVVIATGSAARTLPGGRRLPGAHLLRTLDDAESLRADLRRGGRLVIVGGGFIGSEVAATARKLGVEVTLVSSAEGPLADTLGPAFGSVVSQLHLNHGVQLVNGSRAGHVTGEARVDGVVLDTGRRLPADSVLVCVGSVPNVGWLQGTGVALDDGVLCDAAGGTTVPGVVAVGDCAAWFDPAIGRHHRVEHWTGARERATAAASSLLSGGAAAPPPLRAPYFWSDLYEARIQFAGHAQLADSVSIEVGSVEDQSFLAVYRSCGVAVAALAMNQPKPFTAVRRTLVARTDLTSVAAQGVAS